MEDAVFAETDFFSITPLFLHHSMHRHVENLKTQDFCCPEMSNSA